MAKNFKDLSEQEILALAISSKETDAHLSRLRRGIESRIPATSQIFEEMSARLSFVSPMKKSRR